MTRTERVLARRWKALGLLAALLLLTGGAALGYLWDAATTARADLAHEADLRGTAVSTLAGDVRALRAQVKAAGKTPVAPDPTKAVEDLGDRAEVPVPIPGPPGPKGDKGDAGKAAPTITPPPGPSGAPGVQGLPGADSTVPGPAGPQGETGKAGADGKDGRDGSPPSGWTWTDGQGVEYDCTPDSDGSTHYTCRAVSSPEPSEPPTVGGMALSVLAGTGAYRRVSGVRVD